MTVKQFFKSQAFKCIIVLFAILILCGALLTVAYGFLEVSSGERLQRAVNKIYSEEIKQGEEVVIRGENYAIITADENDPKSLVAEPIKYEDSTIISAYKINFKNSGSEEEIAGKEQYLVQSKGLHGYTEGTVTCWVAISVDSVGSKILNIAKVQLGESTGQTFMNKITAEHLDKFTKADFSQATPPYFSPTNGYVSTGASLSSTAIDNAVNGAVKYVNEVQLHNVVENFYESLELRANINVNAGMTTAKLVQGTTDVEYDVYTKGYGDASSFHMTVVVGEDKTIKSYSIAEGGNGSTGGYEDKMPANVKDGSLFVGKDVNFFTGVFGENMQYKGITGTDGNSIQTGASDHANFASHSTYLCANAGAFATKNYDAVYAHLTGGEANE